MNVSCARCRAKICTKERSMLHNFVNIFEWSDVDVSIYGSHHFL